MGIVVVEGRVVKGLGVGGRYVAHPYYSEKLGALLGCRPYPGTLNFEANMDWRELAARCIPELVGETLWEGRRLGAVYAWRARLLLPGGGEAGCLVIRPLLSRHPPNVLEVVACEKLAEKLGGVVKALVECRENPDYTRAPRLPGEPLGEKNGL